MARYFYELTPGKFTGKTIVLDVDGTILRNNSLRVRPDVSRIISEMTSRNKVLLCSNSLDKDRLKELAATLGVAALDSTGKKPGNKVVKLLSSFPRDSLLVIGDKWLTDGLLALRAGARFVKVRRVKGKNERPAVKAVNFADDVVDFFIKHWPFFTAALVYLAISLIIVFLVVSSTGGVLTYVFDDVYIHMAIAKNLVLNNVWGINAGEFSSSASSIIYPLILAGSFLAFGINEISPLLINLFFGVLSVLTAYVVFKKFGLKAWVISLILLFFVFVMPLFIVSFTGMEHTLHIAASLAFVYLSSRALTTEQIKKRGIVVLIALAALMTAIRYESMFVLFVVCLLFLFKKKWKTAFSLGFFGMLPIIVFGFFSLSQGAYFFPNPLLLKAKFEHFALWDLMKLGYYGLQNMTESHILLLVAGAVSLIALSWKKSRILKDAVQAMLIIFVGSTLLHLTFAQTGWGHRYEAYLVAVGMVALIIGFKKYLADKFAPKLVSFWTLVIVVLLFPFIFRAGSLLITVPAMTHVHEQNYQWALFLKKYYEGKTVLANDIGAVSFLPNTKIIDFVGLGNNDITRARRDGYFTKEWLKKYLQEQDAKIAIVHDSWFWDFGVPSDWTKVGTWTNPSRAPDAARTVTFYAIGQETENLKQYFEEFSETDLPASVTAQKYF